jgi:hypothetical protein
MAAAGRVPVVVAPHTLALDEPTHALPIAGSGSRKKSAFMLAQELLNASPDHPGASPPTAKRCACCATPPR